MDKTLAALKSLYLIPNPFQIWAWVLTLLAVLFFFPGTRRIGGMGFLVVLGCMGFFFGMQKMMGDFAPKEVPVDTPSPTGRRRRH